MCFQRPRRKENMPTSVLDIQLVDTSRELPSDFAIRIIEREINLEKYWKEDTVQELVELYSVAIEHYSMKCDEKAFDYQMRMQKMLRRPEVLGVFSAKIRKQDNQDTTPGKITEETKETEAGEERGNTGDMFNAVLQQENDPSPIHFDMEIATTDLLAAEAVKSKEDNDKITGDKLTDSVKSQESDLVTRLKRRKISRNLTASFVMSPFSEAESPKSFTSETNERELENLIQVIMEKNYEEKSNKIAEITVKYTTEINLMEDSGMMGMVITQMKQNMKQEIEEIGKEFDEKRKAEIKTFKEEYHANKLKVLQS